MTFLCLLIAHEGYAVPAAPFLHTLSQPDGTTFKARLWGDENIHGWETEEGYTIVFDKDLNSWTYAVNDPDGNLVSSGLIVRKDEVPSTFEKKLKPKVKALEGVILKRLSREVGVFHLREGISAIAEPVVPPAGTGYIPTILINFKDRSWTYTPASFNTLLFGTGNYSMKDYYQEVSYGAFSVSSGPGGVVGWYTAANGHDYYGADDIHGNDMWPGTLVREAVAAADAAGFNFAPYDQNGDCYVDVVIIVHQGTGEEAGGPSTDIWSHKWELNTAYYYGYSDGGEYITNDACPGGGYIKVNDYIIVPEILWGSQQTMGVFAHEYGHALGLPDLYDRDFSSKGIGEWSLMASGTWNFVTRVGDRPAHMDAWSKYKLGWITPTQVSGTLTNEPITQAATTADVYKLLAGTPNSGEYFLVENRQKVGFDVGLPGAGILIWHVDAAVSSNNEECYPSGPSCATQHYKVALVQADNLWELEKNIDKGDAGDPYPGSTNNTTFNASSSPNSNLYNGSPSNVSVTSISASGSTMYATLSVSTPTVTHTLTVTKNGTGSGTVTSSPAGINCGTDCTEGYTSGTAVTLTVTPDAGSTFTGWSGDLDCSDGVVTMNANKTCTATFTKDPEPPPSCTYSINPTSENFAYQGGSGTVTVTRNEAICEPDSWTATSNASWITITGGSSGSGNGTVTYTVAINTSSASRGATLSIAGKNFAVTQDRASGKTINVMPSSVDFGSNKVGTKAVKEVTITNTGSGEVTISSLSITGANASRFGYSSLCGVLPSGSSCVVSVIYMAGITSSLTKAGVSNIVENHTARLVINSDDDSRPEIEVSLYGSTSEVVEPQISVSPSSIEKSYVDIEFGDRTRLSIKNEGTGELVIENIVVQGRDKGEFAIDGDCSIINAGGNCGISVVANYRTMGSKEATIAILSNAKNRPQIEVPIRVASATMCGVSIDRTNVTMPSSGLSGSIGVTVDNSSCWWKANSSAEWIGVYRNDAWRQGNGQVEFQVAVNSTNRHRVGHIYIGNRVYTVVQAKAGQVGLIKAVEKGVDVEAGAMRVDVGSSNYSIFTDTGGLWSENYINALYAVGLTTGCNQEPLKYCPSDAVTRETGGVFIVRGIEGNPIAGYCGSVRPFNDVESELWSCGHIKRLYERGITRGCDSVGSLYCPYEGMTRWQMAVMIIRAFYGDDFSYNGEPYFSDVSVTDSGFKYIQKMKALGFTKAEGMFYPDRIVTREEMAAFLSRAFLGME